MGLLGCDTMYQVRCPFCEAGVLVDVDAWSWPFLYSSILVHLDTHPVGSPSDNVKLAERLADEAAADHLMWRLLMPLS